MTTMLDKCAVAGDITQGIDRRGVWTAAITVIGGTSGTAVKLVSSDTVDGEYTDYKTLISASDAETDQYKGFVVDLHGAKKFIKVTGAVMATAVFGDCDHDVKAIAITAGEVPSGADLEDNHEVTITENGEIEITPATGKDGMKKVTATVNVSDGGADLEDNKEATINVSTYTEPVEVLPSEGKDGMKKATITLSNIPEIEANKEVTIDVSTYTEPVEVTPTAGKDGMAKATITLSNIPSGSVTLYAWNDAVEASTVYTLSETPSVGQYALYGRNDGNNYNQCALVEITEAQSSYIKVTNSEGTMQLQLNRNDSRDINF